MSECKGQPNPREVQHCELERHKQESEDKGKKVLEKEKNSICITQPTETRLGKLRATNSLTCVCELKVS